MSDGAKRVRKVDGGWKIVGRSGHDLPELFPEICVMADLKHGLALFHGSRSRAEEMMAGVRRRGASLGVKEEVNRETMVVALPGDVSEDEMSFMLENYRLPRRVVMRMRSKQVPT